MIKIIKKGVKPLDKEYIATCKHCKTVVSYSDIDTSYSSFLCCPVCSEAITIDFKNREQIVHTPPPPPPSPPPTLQYIRHKSSFSDFVTWLFWKKK